VFVGHDAHDNARPVMYTCVNPKFEPLPHTLFFLFTMKRYLPYLALLLHDKVNPVHLPEVGEHVSYVLAWY
jgi:hypothetical protein